MAVTLTSWSLALLFTPVITSLCLYIHYRLVSSKYWSKLNVPHLKPNFILGNLWKGGILEIFMEIMEKWHLENKEKKILGFWNFWSPALLIIDLDIIKRMLIQDFNIFRDRGMELNTEIDPLAGHLFALQGKRWRNLRVRLTPTFTSGKMKLMFPTMLEVGNELQNKLREAWNKKESFEVKDLMARFSTDVISSCAFGLETYSLQNPKSEFRQFGIKVFKFDIRSFIVNMILTINPKIIEKLKIRILNKDVSDFFIGAVRDTIEYREKNKIARNDFLQLLIQLMRAGKIEDVDRTPLKGLDDEEIVNKFSLHDAAAQCFVFFAAGFETSSTALTFGLYELALHSDIQKKLQNDIDETLKKHNNELKYEAMCEMEYLDMFVQETLRKYPPVGNLQRKSSTEYYIPELGVTIPKGTGIMISVNGIHRDPDNYPDPDKFDPERFTQEEKSKRHPMAYLPFGDGPRSCIGNRFALMQIKVALISILKEYNVEVCKKTPIPIVYEIRSFFPKPKGGMHLFFSKRQ